ncbi:MAG: aminodeoxychorismate synthase component I, partial [Planctomycetales bacterium]|nr:aminodeoxychorismate synthase component I [Planctomycetales bacterium]
PAREPWPLPCLAMGMYDVVVAFDHATREAWLISQGWSADHNETSTQRHEQAARRLSWFRDLLLKPNDDSDISVSFFDGPTTRRQTSAAVELGLGELQPMFPAGSSEYATRYSNFTHDSYCTAVQQAIDYIYAGDIFQVNLAQQLWIPAEVDSNTLYTHLRSENSATFAGYFDLGEFQILSASPERFIKVDDRHVETRPIKGTRPRRIGPEADLFAGADLRHSGKDRAENVMIVDLMRNDLSRVCQADSVQVSQLCEIESYEYVQHLVSAVTGQLRQDQCSIDLLSCAFPGGSITGAPKIRAMEIIAEIEPHARGAYCGSLGYINWDGSLDLSILIRTITAGRGWWQLPVGGGIVAQSQPEREYEETWHKAAGMLRGIDAAVRAKRHEPSVQRNGSPC